MAISSVSSPYCAADGISLDLLEAVSRDSDLETMIHNLDSHNPLPDYFLLEPLSGLGAPLGSLEQRIQEVIQNSEFGQAGAPLPDLGLAPLAKRMKMGPQEEAPSWEVQAAPFAWEEPLAKETGDRRQAWEGRLLTIVQCKASADTISSRISHFVSVLLQAIYSIPEEKRAFFESFKSLRLECLDGFLQVVKEKDRKTCQLLLTDLFESYPVGEDGESVRTLFNHLKIASSLFSITLKKIRKIDPQLVTNCITSSSEGPVEIGNLRNKNQTLAKLAQNVIEQLILLLYVNQEPSARNSYRDYFPGFVRNRTECMRLLRNAFPLKSEKKRGNMLSEYFMKFSVNPQGQTFGDFLKALNLSSTIIFLIHQKTSIANPLALTHALEGFQLQDLLKQMARAENLESLPV